MKLADEIYIIYKNQEIINDQEPSEFTAGLISSILINDLTKLAEIYRYSSFNSTNTSFVLSLDLDLDILSEDSASDIAAFFFLPNYWFEGNKPVINFVSNHPYTTSEVQLKFDSIAQSQGYKGSVINVINNFLCIELSGSDDYESKLLNYYNNLLELNDNSKILLFIFQTAPFNLSKLIKNIAKVENHLIYNYPKFSSLLIKNKDLQQQIHYYENKVQFLIQQLEDEKAYRSYLQDNHQAKIIQDFYNKEYEVLPLWYKRLGHLIKILTGRRKSKSLISYLKLK